MIRVYNFSPGPSMLPLEVLQQASQGLINYQNSGMGVAEFSHRSAMFGDILQACIKNFKTLLNIPEHYHVLFTQGGAVAQNALVPMNLLKNQSLAQYGITGHWSQKSYEEAQRYASFAKIECVHQAPRDINLAHWQVNEQAAYLHLCSNETVDGIQLFDVPTTGVPIVADMSSDILSRPIKVENYGVIYGGAQKNIGISGLTFLIVRDDLLGRHLDICPQIFQWEQMAKHQSLLNTPSTFAIYIAHLVFEHWLNLGGMPYIEKNNQEKAKMLYDCIDQSALYHNDVEKSHRSHMNVVFRLADESLNQAFLDQAKMHQLEGLKGHKQVGGMRASIYNAMPLEGVAKLIDYMKAFEKNGGTSF